MNRYHRYFKLNLSIIFIFLFYSGFTFAQNIRDEVILITINSTQFEVELYDNNATHSLLQSLPQKITMSNWGHELYGKLTQPIDYSGDKQQDVFEVGEVALWPSGNALCIFFGSTPVSVNGEPRMASKGVAFGKIIGPHPSFDSIKGNLSDVRIELKK